MPPSLEELAARIAAMPNGPTKTAMEGKLRAAQTKQASKASVASPAPYAATGSPLGGGPGGASGGGGATEPGADPYEADFQRRETELAAQQPGYVPRETPTALEAVGGMMLSGLQGVDSSVTFGLGARVAKEAVGGDLGDVMETAKEDFPGTNVGGRVGGMFVPGAGVKKLAGGAASLAGMKGGQGLVETLARGLLAGTATGAVSGAAEAATGGESLQGVTDAAVEGGKMGAVLSPIGSVLGWFGNRQMSKLRDPRTPTGRDLALAEEGGASTSMLTGIKPGPAVQGVIDDVRGTPGKSPEALAADRAAPVLGGEADRQAKRALEGIGMQNEAMYSSGAETTSKPLLQKAIKTAKDYTDKGVLLPGTDVRDVVKQVRASGNYRVVKATSDEAHAADPELIEEAALWKHLGLIKENVGPDDVVVFEPRAMTAKGIDTTARAFDKRANVAGGNYDPAKEPFAKLGNAARETRAQLGPEWEATKEAQSAALQRKGNLMEASGLPRDTKSVDLGDLGTQQGLYRAVRAYRTVANSPADALLDEMAASNPTLREALDTAAATGAVQRLSGAADLQFTPSGNVSPYGFMGAAKLHADPAMRYFGANGMAPIPAMTRAADKARREE
jgi:hypothetical protein